ncbi:MAG: class 1 fructose-bisphosphatase [Armatimonadota bacterium]
MPEKIITIERFIAKNQKLFPKATGELSKILNEIALAGKIINREVNKAGLIDILGFTGEENSSGETQQKLDVYANNTIVKFISSGNEICVIASEESEDVIIPKSKNLGKYVLLIDPLDGSSNIDANVSIGTIFSIYRRTSDREDSATTDDCLQKGVNQVAAGYIIYGSSTVLVMTTGMGVHGFTLDPSIGEFILSHKDIKIPPKSKIYSINEGYYNHFEEGVKKYLDYLKKGGDNGSPYSSRYIGSLVADFHRNLLYGGIFLYTATMKNPEGKLRLLYECNPLSFIVEQAGGLASNGRERILEIEPKDLHQRTSLYIGSREDVQMLEKFIAETRARCL